MLPARSSTFSQGFLAFSPCTSLAKFSTSSWASASCIATPSVLASSDLTEVFTFSSFSMSCCGAGWNVAASPQSSLLAAASSSPAPGAALASLQRRSSPVARRHGSCSSPSAPRQFRATICRKEGEPATRARRTVAALGPSAPMKWMPSVAMAMASSSASASAASSSALMVALPEPVARSFAGEARARSLSFKRTACIAPSRGLEYARESSPPASSEESSCFPRKLDKASIT
mmetsp:Transcript_76782/g.225417  ORF Transcript_76782/g.225417 Transcript_76782/m.225417 type:complete len:232 (+) Transcript_76782:137-832(+)